MQKILQHLSHKNTLQEIPVETLQQITQEYPFFAVGQYLLTKKLLETEGPGYEKQFQKTLIYFHNPLWLQYQLPTQTLVDIPAPGNKEYPEVKEDAVEAGDDTSPSSHDLIEDVVLHQEIDYSTAEVIADHDEKVLETIIPEQITVQKEPEKQTIQREEPFTFQAFHTVDYFASQGIKLGQDALQQDKLGKQLKSFTEWLKTMRRLPETSVVEILDKINDGEIAQIAAHSLEEKEVLTEAMAEVLVKQKKYEKAKELYTKLSLLNPHKSTYFAAKTEDLKQF
ncbi:MAG: hypothetical protein ABIN89_27740 [Chitinophagaceae bacterium]